MSHVQIRRHVVRFGGVTSDGEIVYAGIPGPPHAGSAIAAAPDRATYASYANEAGDVAFRLPLGRMNGASPLAIAIAPDSAIHSCDIALAGAQTEGDRHRVSPGNPLVGCLDADYVTITLFHDSVGAPSGIATVESFPLRLELWYGSLPVRTHRRAGYFAHFLAAVDVDETRDFYVCVDGRNRVDVTINGSAGGGTVTVSAFDHVVLKKSAAEDDSMAVALPLNEAGDLTVAIDNTAETNTRFSFYGNPLTVLRIRLAGSVDASLAQIRVHAQDD
jgi:hypothetical protein